LLNTAIRSLKRLEIIFKPARELRKDFITNLFKTIKQKSQN